LVPLSALVLSPSCTLNIPSASTLSIPLIILKVCDLSCRYLLLSSLDGHVC
jgi:hypothetical protein